MDAEALEPDVARRFFGVPATALDDELVDRMLEQGGVSLDAGAIGPMEWRVLLTYAVALGMIAKARDAERARGWARGWARDVADLLGRTFPDTVLETVARRLAPGSTHSTRAVFSAVGYLSLDRASAPDRTIEAVAGDSQPPSSELGDATKEHESADEDDSPPDALDGRPKRPRI